jgi:hypothetical protein
MRTLLLLLAASTFGTWSASAVAATGGPLGSPIRLVEVSSQARAGGAQRVRYAVLQRVQPLLAVGRPGTAATVVAGDAVALSYEQEPDGWVSLGTLTVESYGPHAAAAEGVAAPAGAPSEAPTASAPRTLAMAPVGPDPARGHALVVDVALPGAGPARLELMDVQGRRMAGRELGSLGAGRHTVDLSAERRSLAPGVYLLRLTQGAEARVARVTIVE